MFHVFYAFDVISVFNVTYVLYAFCVFYVFYAFDVINVFDVLCVF